MSVRVLVLAKQPVPGRVKTRLCPPCTPAQAASIAAAAIEDTLDAVDACAAAARTLVLDGTLPARPGWTTIAQPSGDLDARLAYAFRATARAGWASLLIGMDTPQVTAALLDRAATALAEADAVFGAAEDGGWWALGLRDPAHAEALLGIPTSRPDTGDRTLHALQARGLRVTPLPVLRDVDTAADATEVAAGHPHGRFAAAVRAHLTESTPNRSGESADRTPGGSGKPTDRTPGGSGKPSPADRTSGGSGKPSPADRTPGGSGKPSPEEAAR